MNKDLRRALAPTGILRAAINLGNPMLATAKASGLSGISVNLAQRLAHFLDVPLHLSPFNSARHAVAAVRQMQADIGFFAIDEERSTEIYFSRPYVLIDGCFLVRDASSITDIKAIDHVGIRVAVGRGSAYDLFLTRHLKSAHIIRAATSSAVVELFLNEDLEVAAGVRQHLESDMARHKGLRLIMPAFMIIPQAMALPGSCPQLALRFLEWFIDDAIREGFIRDSIKNHGLAGVRIAPASEITRSFRFPSE